MINKNELIFINKILNAELTIRKAAKRLGLRRDDLIKRIKEMLKNDEENIKKLNVIIITNKILFDNLNIKEAAKQLDMTEKELDTSIKTILINNQNKFKRYEQIRKTAISGYC